MHQELRVLLARKERIDQRQRSLFRFVQGNHLKRQKAKLQIDIDAEISYYLCNTDKEFLKLFESTKLLLTNVDIPFKVTSEGASPLTYMTKKFEGKIHSNGFLYLKAKSNSLEIFEIMGWFYPKSYAGTIDITGRSRVKVQDSDIGFLGRVPSSYLGSIDSKLNLKFETKDSWGEIDGNVHVNKIIADPFKGDTNRRNLYLRNRQEIRSRITLWKEKNVMANTG